MNYSISQIIKSDKKEDNRNSINSLDLEKKKIKYKKVENKKIIDFLFKKALMENKFMKNDENNKNHNLMRQNIAIRPTPFQIYEKIKLLTSYKLIKSNIENLHLLSNSRKSSIINNSNDKQKIQFKKIFNMNKKNIKFKYLNYNSPLRERILKMRLRNKNNSFNSRKSNDNNSFNKNNKTNFSMIIRNDLSINQSNDKMTYINGRNTKTNFKNNYKPTNIFNKEYLLSGDFSFYSLRNEAMLKNLPKINNSIIQQIIVKT